MKAQHRHPPPAGAAARQRPPTASSCSPRCCCQPAGLARSSTTATRSAWATTSGWATATASAPRCSGPPDRNAGFSTADPGQLYLPVDHGPGLRLPGRSTCESQLRELLSSLLHWTRRMIHASAAQPAFGLGSFTELRRLQPERARPPSARPRETATTSCSCVNNLSRFAQPVELDLRQFAGHGARSSCSAGCRSRRSASCPTCCTLAGLRLLLVPADRPPRPRGGAAAVNDT